MGTKILMIFFMSLLAAVTSIQGKNINFFLSLFPFTVLPFANKEFTKSTYNNFLTIYSIITVVSLIVWGLVIIGDVPRIGTIAPLNSLKSYSYAVYPLLVRGGGEGLRFECVFDEAGVVGTLSGMFLCIQKFDFKDRRNIILLVSGLCSMSMFFYIMIAGYGVLYYVTEKRSVWKATLMIIITGVVLCFIQYVPILNRIIGSRLEWNATDMRFEGDNRTNETLTDYLYSIAGTREFWLGVNDRNDFWSSVEGECNIYITIIMNGVLFCILYLGFIVAYGLYFRRSWSTFFLYIYVFLTCVYQRPFLFNAYFIFLWTYMARLETMGDTIAYKNGLNTQ